MAKHFYLWATTVFYWDHGDQPQWSAWDMILPRHPAQLLKDFAPERYLAIAEFRHNNCVDDVEETVNASRAEPLSEWDAEIYSISSDSNVLDPLFEDDFIDPYSPILRTIEMNRFQLGWPGLWDHFTKEEKNKFWQYGNSGNMARST